MALHNSHIYDMAWASGGVGMSKLLRHA